MMHLGTKMLETERLILRKYSLNDAEDMFNNWASNPNVTKFMTWQPYSSIDEVRKYILECIDSYSNDSTYNWIIEFKESGQAIGSISIVEFRENVNAAVVGYCIGESYWHKGITTEAFKQVIKFLFEEVGVNRIEAYHDVNNPHSGGVIKKCGLTYEGTNRQASFANQGIYDRAVYAYLREEYFNGD